MSNTEVLDILSLAHAIVESGWCRGYLARNRRGDAVYSFDPSARRWCASGALHLAFQQVPCRDPSREWKALYGWVESLLPARPAAVLPGLWEWNDAPERRKRDVLRLLERAAAKVGK